MFGLERKMENMYVYLYIEVPTREFQIRTPELLPRSATAAMDGYCEFNQRFVRAPPNLAKKYASVGQ